MLNSKNPCLFHWNYDVVLTKCYNIDLDEYYTYGIKVTGLQYTEVLQDVSVCRETVAKSVKLFNQHQLSPVHLHDVVEDMLS